MTARLALFAGFVATVAGANWALGRYGVVPVAPGLEAPAGVWFAGLAFGLRDALHERAGRTCVLAAVAVGAALAYFLDDAVTLPGGLVPIAVASAVAFGLSELADLAVYEPRRLRSWPTAVAASNVVGAVVDSALFLWLAFGALDHMTGQVVGKALMVAVSLPLVWSVRRAVPRHRLHRPGA